MIETVQGGSQMLARCEPPAPGAVLPQAAICEATSDACRRVHGDRLRAVILTGSLARNEGTFLEQDGRSTLLGDAEFLLVFHEAAALPAPGEIDALRGEIGRRLSEQGVSARIELSAAFTRYLRRLPPHIFACELSACGRVIWGDEGVLSDIPPFSVLQPPLEDAWRLLCNRVTEQLEGLEPATMAATMLSPDLHYRTVKLYLDMATSLLVFMDAYEPTYRQRARKLEDLALNEHARATEPPFPLARFARRVRACTAWKLSPLEEPCERGWEFWTEAMEYADRLCRWEMERLTGMGRGAADQALWREWMRMQPVRLRLRGWLYLLRQRGWRRSGREWPQWARHGWKASPRYWIYSAACSLLFRVADAKRNGFMGERANGAPACLPIEATYPARASHDWREQAAGIARDYRELLVGTRT